MATPFLPGIENHILILQIHIIPGEAVNLAYPGHGIPYSPEIILDIQVWGDIWNNFMGGICRLGSKNYDKLA